MNPEVQAQLQLIGSIVTVLCVIGTGTFTVIVARQNRKARQDRTPADSNEATKIANDLILRLLDRANNDVERYQGLLDAVSAEAASYKGLAALVPGLRDDLDRAVRERDRLRKAIHYLEAKARTIGTITYSEVVEWAQVALDPDADGALFDLHIRDTLPDGLEDTVTTL
ncbi:hypothetical protein SOM10_11745 [Microbacterium sp. CFBP9023]|uniref:hypothetical protein n=1 Tax=Microbacterium sp. CFBP9023 TaxID=3096535 RepID=UPI002A69D45D|nr:hypothetical protein [Microbacterium sp. CFBP9023]MDY0984569.1 hypothetical protein [Microbacterium sp. CFBP9023]